MGANAQLVKQYLGLWATRDLDAAQFLFADDAVVRSPMHGERMRAEDFMKSTAAFASTIEAIDILSIVEDGPQVCAVYRVTSRLAPELDICEWFVIEGGKIRVANLYYDTALVRAAIASPSALGQGPRAPIG